jgi:hypothetical protein
MCRLILFTRNSVFRHSRMKHLGYQRGDCVDILEDNQHCGIEVDGRDIFRAILVPLAPKLRFKHLLEPQPYEPNVAGHRRLRFLNLDALEAIGRKAKRAELDAMDQIVITAPSIIDALTIERRPAQDRRIIGL